MIKINVDVDTDLVHINSDDQITEIEKEIKILKKNWKNWIEIKEMEQRINRFTILKMKRN